jgi:hypothetical protein
MDKKEKSLYILAGALAGFANGLLGTGGGLAIVPILLGPLKLPPKRAFATSVFIMTPICALSAALYWFQGRASLGHAAPFLLGGLAGGLLCGKLYGKIPAAWLGRIFGLLMLYGGLRCFF